jgi:predicted transcriptional regulator
VARLAVQKGSLIVKGAKKTQLNWYALPHHKAMLEAAISVNDPRQEILAFVRERPRNSFDIAQKLQYSETHVTHIAADLVALGELITNRASNSSRSWYALPRDASLLFELSSGLPALILRHLEQNYPLSAKELITAFPNHKERTISHSLWWLTKEGKLIASGKKRGRIYALPQNRDALDNLYAKYPKIRMIWAFLEAQKGATGREISRNLSLSHSTACIYLRQMKSLGLVQEKLDKNRKIYNLCQSESLSITK